MPRLVCIEGSLPLRHQREWNLLWFPLPGARWHRDRWQKGREPRVWGLVRVAAGANVRATRRSERGDGKWGDSRTYWGRTDVYTYVRPSVVSHVSEFQRVLNVGRMKGHRNCTPTRDRRSDRGEISTSRRRITSRHCSRERQLPSSFSLDFDLPRDVDP